MKSLIDLIFIKLIKGIESRTDGQIDFEEEERKYEKESVKRRSYY